MSDIIQPDQTFNTPSLIPNTKVIYITSKDRLTGSSSQFTYEIPNNILTNMSYVCLLQADVPKSFYNVQAQDSTFILMESNTSAIDVEVSIEVPPGTYTRRTLLTTLQTLLTQNSPTNSVYTITIPTSPDTGTYTYICTPSPTYVSSSFIFSHQQIYENMGFDNDSTNVFNINNTLVSSNVINLSAERTLFVRSSLCVDSLGGNVLQPIFIADNQTFSNIVFEQHNVDYHKKQLSTKSSNTFDFYITDQNNHTVSLNGLNVVYTLLFLK